MANTVIALKKSATPSAAPLANQLANGELAINYADGILYYKAANGSIASIQSLEGNSFGTVNADGTLIVADTVGDILSLQAGSNIVITGDAINDIITISANLSSVDPSYAFARANIANITADRAWNHANAAFVKANSALANTTGTFAGDLTLTGDLTVSGGQVNLNTDSTRSKLLLYGTGSVYAIGMQSGVTFGGLNDWAMTFQFNSTPTRGFWWGHDGHSIAQGAMALTNDGKLTVAKSLRLGFGESDATDPGANYTLEVNGSFAAQTKSFVINHPTKPDMKLRYGSLEGPENGVYVRGRVQGSYIYLPDYWSNLVDKNSITVSLTPIGKTKMPSVLSYDNEKIVLYSSKPIDCFYHIFAERKDVDKLVVEY